MANLLQTGAFQAPTLSAETVPIGAGTERGAASAAMNHATFTTDGAAGSAEPPAGRAGGTLARKEPSAGSARGTLA